ncbi:MAG: SPOR domain-containing protein [Burkholderiales bacterium]|nr:SPOR domain-containing protein [Burkholderiales bacterium]
MKAARPMATSASPDSETSTLKRRARRRLLGSIALVLVAVIALPMIFDAERKPADQDVSVQIPGQEPLVARSGGSRAGTGKSVEPREPRQGSAPPPTSVQEAKGAQEAKGGDPRTGSAAPADPGGLRPPPAADAKSDARVEAKPRPEARPAARPDTKGEAATTLKPQPEAGADAKAAPRREEARVKAILEDKPPAAGGYAVQIGAFAAEDKVREARERLAAAGFATYTEKLQTREGERTRVRAGPFAAREGAEAARERIRALGFAGASVVAR